MRGIVIAGGLGTRLRPLTLTRPKPLMPLVGAPLLEYQICYLRAAGITDICFATNYMADAVEAMFGDGSALEVALTYAVEDEPLDTAGAIRNAYDAGQPDDCVVFNGDVIHNFALPSILEAHERRKADVTLTLREVARPHAYGRVPLDSDGRVEGFYEPTEEQKRTVAGDSTGQVDTINAGLYVMSARALETIPQRRCNIEREVFPKLVAEGWNVFGDVRSDYWIDIGRPVQYLDAVRAIVSGRVDAARPFLRVGDSAADANCEIAESARVSGHSAIGFAAVLSDDCEVSGSALLERVRIGSRSKVSHSVVGEDAVIGDDCVVEEAVVAPGEVLPAGTRIEGTL